MNKLISEKLQAIVVLSVVFGAAAVDSVQAKAKAKAKAAVQQGTWEYPNGRLGISTLLNVQGVPGLASTTTGQFRGVYLRTVQPGCVGSKLSLSPLDVLISLNSQSIMDAGQIDRILQSTGGSSISAQFAHPGSTGVTVYNTSAAGMGFRSSERVNTVVQSNYTINGVRNKIDLYHPGKPVK